MKHKIDVLIIVFIAVLTLLFVPGLNRAVVWSAEKPIVIGMLGDISGFAGPAGVAGVRGATLAMEMAGYQVDGRPIKFIVEDSATDPAVTLDKARKLVETDKACLIIGPLFGGGLLAIAPYLDKVKVPCLTLEGNWAKTVLENEWVWLAGGTLQQQTYAFGIYAYQELGYRKISILACEIAGGREFMEGFITGFTEHNGEIVQEKYYPAGTKDFSPYILGLEKADALETFIVGDHAFSFYPQAKQFGLKVPILEAPGEIPNPQIQKALEGAAVGVKFMASYFYTLDTPGNKEFVEAYKKRWGELPAQVAADGYRDVRIALEVLRKTGGDTSRDAIAKALSGISMDTVRGHISFTPDRVGILDYFVGEVVEVNGEYTYRHLKTYRAMSTRVGDGLKLSLVE